MQPDDRYVSPLASRNASPEMQAIWSPRRKFMTWRQLWIVLAEAEHELGLPVSGEQVAALRGAAEDLDLEAAAAYEKKLRHDVMAHVHAFGDVAPEARGIIHLGATSQFVNCNTELMLIRDALGLVAGKLASAIDRLATFAAEHRSLATLGYTHLQPAQPTTVGKRACLWIQELSIGLAEVEHRLGMLPLRGVKGTTGTQASFLALFRALEGVDEAEAQRRVEALDRLVTEKLGWPADRRLPISGQTYPRVIDGLVASSLGAVAAAAHKMATDLRLLASRKEIEEPFETSQIGSSAMAYKRNPMRSERICGLSRFVIGMIQTPFVTAAEQWMERTLDDSSTRRLTLPEPFLALDGVLELLNNVSAGLVVYPAVIRANLEAELPFMATEEILMAAARRGVDRQDAHEAIRQHSMAAARCVKERGGANDLIERLRGEPLFEGIALEDALDASLFIGRAPEQVDLFIDEVVGPIRERYAGALGHEAELKV
ncbi:adenylosuccinate lyase [Mucisphaera calidilacus]|uniref:Adenylosuccinate lyase n=1 Tax=Mucisphaera calidilacus TaxID=2527982 RepID=A0A518BUK7_9BACT|nr:adenylosuccinate lyase [Mucisphaera calidilacus]QDU70668.1 Adenylosuccinate lyase [Mucisphaera calidilacus]